MSIMRKRFVMKKQIILLSILLVMLVLLTSCASGTSDSFNSEQAGYHKITAEEAKARIDSGDDMIILDVRTQEEYNTDHIEGAFLIPNQTIANTQPEFLPDLDTEILIYCRSGNRSAQAAEKLVDMGYTRVHDFGGIINWPYATVKGP